jgi:hypothetical protein
MTAFNAIYTPKLVVIVMDTLVTSVDDYAPALFTSKMYPVLHLNGIICGTGVADFLQDWAKFVNANMLVRDMLHLDEFAPSSLRELASSEKHAATGKTSTIYHFGYSIKGEVYKAYAYRSTNNFQSESFDYGFILKPPTKYTQPELTDLPTAIEELVKIVIQQKIEDDARPANERVYIGGEIQYAVLQQEGFNMGTCFTFADWADLYHKMCNRLPANRNNSDF